MFLLGIVLYIFIKFTSIIAYLLMPFKYFIYEKNMMLEKKMKKWNLWQFQCKLTKL